jgi:hypothetical protein
VGVRQVIRFDISAFMQLNAIEYSIAFCSGAASSSLNIKTISSENEANSKKTNKLRKREKFEHGKRNQQFQKSREEICEKLYKLI